MMGSVWANFDLRAPLGLLLILLPLLLALFRRFILPRVRQYAEPSLRPWAVSVPATQPNRRHGAMVVAATAWLLLAIAAAGPRLPAQVPGGKTLFHPIDILVLLDVSPSTRATDIAPDRLSRAKLELEDLLARLQGERIGVIAFSGTASWLLAPTQDYPIANRFLQLANPSLFEAKGTAIDAALALAQQWVREKRNGRASAILLVTDGDATSLSPMIGDLFSRVDALRGQGVPLFILGVGSPTGARIPDGEGGWISAAGVPVQSLLDEKGLARLAERSGGGYALAVDGDADWRTLYDHGIAGIPATAAALGEVKGWRELYPYFLAPALLLFVWVYLRAPRAPGGVVLVACILVASMPAPEPAWASDRVRPQAPGSPQQQAFAAYQKGDFVLAQALYAEVSGYEGAMGQGAAAYRRRDYLTAVNRFTAAVFDARSDGERADALFNLGNALFYAGRLQAAADAFNDVLKYRPRDENALSNLARVAGASRVRPRGQTGREGIPGRRGRGLSEMPSENIADTPVDMAPSKGEAGPLIDYGQSTGQFDVRRGTAASGRASAQDEARLAAARKKLSLIEDRSPALTKEMLKLDRPLTTEPEGGPPW